VSHAFSTDQAKTLGIFVIAVVVLAGVLLSFVFTIVLLLFKPTGLFGHAP